MSYFHVLVYTSEPEEPGWDPLTKAMLPFEEYNGDPNPHTIDRDVTEDWRGHFAESGAAWAPTPDLFLDYLSNEDILVLPPGSDPPSRDTPGIYLYAMQGESITVFERYNPQGYWDSFDIPSKPFLRTRGNPPTEAPDAYSCRVQDLDYAAMRQQRQDAFEAKWKKVREHVPPGTDFGAHLKWSDLAFNIDATNRAEVVQRYRNQSTYNVMADAIEKTYPNEFRFIREIEVDGLVLPLPEYLDTMMRDKGGVFHALVTDDGTWVSNGTMGWFATVQDPDPEWGTATLPEALAKLNPDGWVTAVLCHV